MIVITSVSFSLVQRLNEMSPQLAKEKCEAGLMDGNKKKSRNPKIYPSKKEMNVQSIVKFVYIMIEYTK
jgi:hypothetical protein